MSKLSNMQINEILTEFANNNPQIELTENQIQTTVDLFNRLMNEKVNKNKNLWEQEALVTDIAIGLTLKPKGETPDFIFRQHSDNKHLDFFDTFLAYGETKKIEEMLKEYNLPSDILKGLKPNQEIDFVKKYDKNVIEIKGNITFSPDGEKEQNDYLEIYLNGENIYSWHRNPINENVVNNNINSEPYEHNNQEFEDKAPKEQPKRKDGKPRKSTYIGKIVTSNNIIIEESYDRLGRRRLQYAAGTVINGVKVGGRTVKQK